MGTWEFVGFPFPLFLTLVGCESGVYIPGNEWGICSEHSKKLFYTGGSYIHSLTSEV